MRILYLTSNLPFPLMAGHLRYYHFMRELSQRHSITLYSLTSKSFLPQHVRAFDGIAQEVRTFPRLDEQGPYGKLLKEDVRLFYGFEPAMQQLRAATIELAKSGRIDTVVLCGKRVLAAAKPIRGIPIVADICDAESVRVRMRIRHARPAELPRLAMGWALLHSMEQAVARRVDRMLFASPRDRDAVVKRDDPRAAIVPNGVDSEYWRRRTGERGQATILFTGAMHYRPNADAALLLAQEIFPLVRREIPEARLVLVGRDPSEAVRACAMSPGVEVTGLVDDVRPYLEQATVFAAPLRFASGIQNKVLEAMSMEIPVVATTAAADGLYAEGGQKPPIVVADDPAQIARSLVQRIQEEGRAPFAEARRFVEHHFSWRTHARRVESILESAAERLSPIPPRENVRAESTVSPP
jgi:glycosyltransferase involved in cell wall biosynthesis